MSRSRIGFWVPFIFLVLTAPRLAMATEVEVTAMLKDALVKLQKRSSYSYGISVKGDLHPRSSGVMTRVTLRENGTVVAGRYGEVVKAMEVREVKETVHVLKVFRKSHRDRRETVWDGNWIYVSSKHGTPFKMVDCAANRGGHLVEDLYRALLADKTLVVSDDQRIEGVLCSVLESRAELFTSLLSIDAEAFVAIDKATGFPVRLWTSKGKSKMVIIFTDVKDGPVVADSMFVPSRADEYEVVPGLEEDLGTSAP